MSSLTIQIANENDKQGENGHKVDNVKVTCNALLVGGSQKMKLMSGMIRKAHE
jgi:hypothetical protein